MVIKTIDIRVRGKCSQAPIGFKFSMDHAECVGEPV